MTTFHKSHSSGFLITATRFSKIKYTKDTQNKNVFSKRLNKQANKKEQPNLDLTAERGFMSLCVKRSSKEKPPSEALGLTSRGLQET